SRARRDRCCSGDTSTRTTSVIATPPMPRSRRGWRLPRMRRRPRRKRRSSKPQRGGWRNWTSSVAITSSPCSTVQPRARRGRRARRTAWKPSRSWGSGGSDRRATGWRTSSPTRCSPSRPPSAGCSTRRHDGCNARLEMASDASPWKLGGLTLAELASRVWREIQDDEVLDRGAALAYYFLFALFPALLFLTTLLGLLPIPNLMDRLMEYVSRALPPDAASITQKTLREIVRGAHGGLLSLGILGALWAASNGMASITTALNAVYGVKETRPWW